jgi:hypothetical protein
MSKSKELLDSLKNITERKPSPFQREAFDSYTNRYYPNSIHPLPSRYDNAKKFKDNDGEEYVMIDRVYGGLYSKELRQADGTSYKGKLYDKRRLIKRKSHHGETIKFYSRCTATADGRWFDNGGLPIEPPKEIEDDKQGSNPEDSKLD